MPELLVSIIIPCFNVEQYIIECLDSVYAQTYQNIEVLCVNNNSSDSTLKLLSSYQYKREDLIILEENKKGAPAARNLGLKMAKGKFIQFLDADDLLEPDKIEHQLSLINNNNISFVAGAYTALNIDLEKNNVEVDGDIYLSLYYSKLGSTCSNLWKKEIIDNIDGWNESFKSSQETDLMFRILKKNQNVILDNIPKTIARERKGGQISQTDIVGNFKRFIDMRIEILRFIANEMPNAYSHHKAEMYQYLFERIHILAKYDLLAARRYYLKNIHTIYKPHQSEAVSALFIKINNLFGFTIAELVKKIKIF